MRGSNLSVRKHRRRDRLRGERARRNRRSRGDLGLFLGSGTVGRARCCRYRARVLGKSRLSRVFSVSLRYRGPMPLGSPHGRVQGRQNRLAGIGPSPVVASAPRSRLSHASKRHRHRMNDAEVWDLSAPP